MTQCLNLTRRTMLAGAVFASALVPVLTGTVARAEGGDIKTNAAAVAADIAKLERVKVDLIAPPFVHAHAQKAEGGPKVVEFTLTIEEKKIVIDDAGTEVHAMTFNGSVPGPMMVVHEGDYVELTLINPEYELVD